MAATARPNLSLVLYRLVPLIQAGAIQPFRIEAKDGALTAAEERFSFRINLSLLLDTVVSKARVES